MAQQSATEKVQEVQLFPSESRLDARVAIAHLSGEAREYVYDLSWGGEKGSELIWTLDNVRMAGLGFSFHPVKYLRVNLDGWININSGTGEMDNYDWFTRYQDWTHWSHSEDVDLARGLIFDINAEIMILSPGRFQLNAVAGFKYDHWKWKDLGDGVFIYSVDSFRDTTGYFPGNTLGITYEQTYKTPYFGISANGRFGNLELETRLIGSPFVSNDAVDHHHLRGDRFDDRFDNGDMISLDLKGAYRISERYRIELGYAFQKYFRMKGDTTAHFSSGTTTVYPGGAGAELSYQMISIAFHYAF